MFVVIIDRIKALLRLLLALRRGFIFKNYDLPAEEDTAA